MKTFVFVWFDFFGRRRLYVTRALSVHRAQMRYVASQVKGDGLHYLRLYLVYENKMIGL